MLVKWEEKKHTKPKVKDEKSLFNIYGGTQLQLTKDWVNKYPWLKYMIKEVIEESTPFHDAVIVLKSGRRITVEVKEDEASWYDKTGNIGLDAISVFHYKDDSKVWESWIKPVDFDAFSKDIIVKKWGKLWTCDADIQLFIVKDRFTIAYNNKKIASPDFQKYVTSNYSLRINDKKAYKLEDSWKSAAYFLKPVPFKTYKADYRFEKCQITDFKSFNELLIVEAVAKIS